jgi:hypothetical protein
LPVLADTLLALSFTKQCRPSGALMRLNLFVWETEKLAATRQRN